MALVFLGALLDAPGRDRARRRSSPTSSSSPACAWSGRAGSAARSSSGSLLVGGPLGGILVASLGATTALWLNAASFVVSAAIVAGAIPRPQRELDADVDAEPKGSSSASSRRGCGSSGAIA